MGTPWEALGTRSSFVDRRSSFVVGRSLLVFRRLSFGAGRWLVDIVWNPNLRHKAFEGALASSSDTLEDEPSYPIGRPRATSDPYDVSTETLHDCSLANVVSLNVVPLSMGSPAWSHLRGSLTVVFLARSPYVVSLTWSP